jgi:hypothetical protein
LKTEQLGAKISYEKQAIRQFIKGKTASKVTIATM